MKNLKFILLSILATLACISVQAQDLKSVRDKATGKYGYTGKKGKDWVLEPLYDRAGRFSKEGFAVVTVSEKQGIINTAGEWVIKPEYDDVTTFYRRRFSSP